MSNMILFQKPEFGRIRCFVIDNEPWFVAKDVCLCLELSNVSEALSRIDDDERSTLRISDSAGGPERNLVNEYGLYNLTLGSRKPEARQFKRWITHEVIPSIRKTGCYNPGGGMAQMSDGELIARALVAANSTIERIEKERDAERKVLQLKIDQANEERDNAVKTRHQISSKREATIMGRLGNEVKRCERLEKENCSLRDEIAGLKGNDNKSMIVSEIPWIFDLMSMEPLRGTKKVNVFNRLGTALSHLCKSKGVEVIKVRDCGSCVCSYPVEIIDLMRQYIESKDEGNYYFRMMSDYVR